MKIDRYNGTTKGQRKMTRAVAADVLLQIKKRAFIISPGSYFWHPERESLDGSREKPVDIQTAPKKILKECQVCAKGAMFISRALLFNEYTFGDNPESATRKDFGDANADLIETAFENCFMGNVENAELWKAAINFGLNYDTHSRRLKAIMENVVANKGVFRPDKPAKTVAKSV